MLRSIDSWDLLNRTMYLILKNKIFSWNQFHEIFREIDFTNKINFLVKDVD